MTAPSRVASLSRVTALLAPLSVVAARARHRPGHWIWPMLGLALSVAFGGAVAAEAVVSADQAARTSLRGISPLERSVRITWQGPATQPAALQATAALRGLGLRNQTEVTLLDPVRLSGVIVRPAAIAPLERWLPGPAVPGLQSCRTPSCPVLLAGGGPVPARLRAAGVNLDVVGQEDLRSDVPLGYGPAGEGRWPLVVSGDPAGLDRLAALGGVYRAHSWLGELDIATLHSWDLRGFERRLSRAQAGLLQSSTQFGMSAPFGAIDAARAQARAAPQALLLVGGGAITAMALFVVLAAAGLRREQLAHLDRLRAAGATTSQLAAFIAGESAAVCAIALGLGFAGAVVAGTVVATSSGEPVGAVLTHSLIRPAAAIALAAGWVVSSGLISMSTQLRNPHALNLAAVAAVAGLVTGLVAGTRDTGTSAALLAPLCCLAAGVLVFRLAVWLLGPGERMARHASVSTRLAVIGLARDPGLPALAIAFMSVSVGLGGFALAYRATLDRGAADQAANRVPLDALIAAGPSFATPLRLASLSQWRTISHGQVFPVRRTQASYQSGAGVAIASALGVPAQALKRVHGWRSSDGSASLTELARRLVSPGPVRTAGPALTAGTRALALRAYSPQLAVQVTADLRDAAGDVRQLAMGTADSHRRLLRAPVPPGRWEVEGLELDESTGLAVTNGHQNGENAAPATQFAGLVELGPLVIEGPTARRTVPLGGWLGVGAAAAQASGANAASIRFQTTGMPGIVRPRQPSDLTPVPVLVDPQTAAATGPGARLAMGVDDLPVQARVVGVLRRFPTVAAGSGFVIADQAVLASALDAQLPGQGRPDELWISTRRTAGLRAALDGGRLAQLHGAFRADLERALRQAPIARATSGTLIAAAGVSTLLALVGLLLVVQGPFRDRRFEADLTAQGVGPRGLRTELRTRLAVAGVLGIVPGIVIALLLERLAVAAVGAAGTGQPAEPPLVTVVPGVALAGAALGTLVLVLVAGWASSARLLRGPQRCASRGTVPPTPSDDVLQEGWVA